MTITNTASARYDGLGRKGRGRVTTKSGGLDQPYGFAARFEGEAGTNPEELIAAAHASCFTMALAMQLANAGHEDGTLEVTAAVALEKQGDGYAITRSDLQLEGQVPGMDAARFAELANKAKEGCPVSKLLKAEITLTTRFDG